MSTHQQSTNSTASVSGIPTAGLVAPPAAAEPARELPAGPEIDPPEGRYEWNQIQGGGVLITFPKTPIEQVLHWRIEWLRPGLRTGCKFSGYTTLLPDGGPAAEEFTSNFRIQPHRLGFMRRRANQPVLIELNYPGRYVLEAWVVDSDENIVPGVTTRMYEVVNVGVPAKQDQVQVRDAPMPPPPSTG